MALIREACERVAVVMGPSAQAAGSPCPLVAPSPTASELPQISGGRCQMPAQRSQYKFHVSFLRTSPPDVQQVKDGESFSSSLLTWGLCIACARPPPTALLPVFPRFGLFPYWVISHTPFPRAATSSKPPSQSPNARCIRGLNPVSQLQGSVQGLDMPYPSPPSHRPSGSVLMFSEFYAVLDTYSCTSRILLHVASPPSRQPVSALLIGGVLVCGGWSTGCDCTLSTCTCTRIWRIGRQRGKRAP